MRWASYAEKSLSAHLRAADGIELCPPRLVELAEQRTEELVSILDLLRVRDLQRAPRVGSGVMRMRKGRRRWELGSWWRLEDVEDSGPLQVVKASAWGPANLEVLAVDELTIDEQRGRPDVLTYEGDRRLEERFAVPES